MQNKFFKIIDKKLNLSVNALNKGKRWPKKFQLYAVAIYRDISEIQ